MYQIDWGDLTPAAFLKTYWQKKPLLIKKAFKNFTDPLSADELAGLAMEEHIQSRIIAKTSNQNWLVEHGPFEDYTPFGESDWSLLVQATNNWSENTNSLLSAFNFVPNWRLDDVMVSFSTPNGGVGPHLDQYDVFIIQGEGKRHWQVGLPDDSLQTLVPHPDLKQVSDFTPCIDVITEAGDLLYIPPNHPHNGKAITNALNYSIGFQSPNPQELWSGFADKLLDNNEGEQRFNDPTRTLTKTPEELSLQDIAALKSFMLAELESQETINQFLGKQLTQCHHTLELLIPVEPFKAEDIQAILTTEDISLKPVLGMKALLIEEDKNNLYVCGEAFELNAQNYPLARLLAKKMPLTSLQLKSSANCLINIQLLTSLLNKGFWYID